MTYTTQQLQAMSDFEVNKALAEKFGAERTRVNPRCASTVDVMDVSGYWLPKNYCNNPLGVMPLAIERKISIEYCHYGKWWSASAWEQTGKNEDTMIANFGDKENPLRAIACLILMMED